MAACACLATAVAPPVRAAEPAEAPPRLVSAVVQKSPTRSRLTIAFAPVPSATGYNLQASKALTFTRLVVDSTSESSPFTDVVVAPGVYFVRLRALGPGGPGPFGLVEVVNALASGLQILDRGGSAQQVGGAGSSPASDSAASAGSGSSDLPAASPVSPGGATVAGPGPAASPVSPGGTTGAGPAPAASPVSPGGATVAGPAPAASPVSPGGATVAGSAPAAAPPASAGPLAGPEPSTTGAIAATTGLGPAAVRADAELTAIPAAPAVDPASAIPPPISEQNLAALGPLRMRYEALRADLQQIEALRQALAASATTVLRQLAGTRDARESAELVNELSALQAARREIDGEIERNLLELGRILSSAPSRH